MIVAAKGGGSVAKTRHFFMQTDCNRAGLSLLKLSPVTGRTHQLRYQCAKRGHPILGDAGYGDFKLNKLFQKSAEFRRMFLHSYAIDIKIYIDNECIDFTVESPLPKSFLALLKPNKAIQKVGKNLPTSNADMLARQRQRVMR